MALGIKHIAELASVSTTTVSHVINSTRFVSDEKRERVLQAMRQLNYRPNRLASGLRRRRSSTLGLLLPDITNPYFAEIARGVEDACFEREYSAVICNSDANPKNEEHYLSMLAEKQMDGIVLVNVGNPESRTLESVGRDIPFIMLDRELPGITADSIQVDNRHGGRLAADFLFNLGHRDIVCIGGLPGVYPPWERVEGFVDQLREHGLDLPKEAVMAGDFQAESGYEGTRRALQNRKKPTAVFAANDLMAYGAIRAIVEAGLRVPDDVSVVGFDDISLSKMFNPALTTVNQPRREMGRTAVQLLLERIADPGLAFRRIMLPLELQIRQSAAKVR